MKIIDGTNLTLGRLASCAAKLALKGEEVAVLNCENVIITGNKKYYQRKFKEGKEKIGSGQQGPKYSSDFDKIVKRAIRGMLPRARIKGRGKDAYNRIKCYIGIPEGFKGKETEKMKKAGKKKFTRMGEILK